MLCPVSDSDKIWDGRENWIKKQSQLKPIKVSRRKMMQNPRAN